MQMRVLLVANTAWSIYNFRRGLIVHLLNAGHQVDVLAPSDGASSKLVALGCGVSDLTMDNKGTHVGRDMALVWRLARAYRKLRPDVVIHFTIKPVIYGSLVAAALKVPTINTITGLGTAFMAQNWLNRLVESLYRISLRRAANIFFLNADDMRHFLAKKLVRENRVTCLPGEGVDVHTFNCERFPDTSPVQFLLIARMLWDKGVGQFIEAARQLGKNRSARFALLGPVGVDNRSAICREQIDAWVSEGVVEYLGETSDVRPFIAAAHCVVLPSYYREGVPRSLLEAAAMGRPIITTDAVGCREVVDDGINGFLCAPRSATSLIDSMRRFLALPVAQQHQMGLEGRDKVEKQFDEQIVIAAYEVALREISQARGSRQREGLGAH